MFAICLIWLFLIHILRDLNILFKFFFLNLFIDLNHRKYKYSYLKVLENLRFEISRSSLSELIFHPQVLVAFPC